MICSLATFADGRPSGARFGRLAAGLPLVVLPAAALAQAGAGQGSGGGSGGGNAGLDTSGDLFGDLGGARPWLNDRGVTVGLSETGEVFGNPTGGIHRGAAYDGLTQLSLGLDLGRLLGLPRGTINLSGEQIHGRNLNNDDLGALDTVSGIAADRATRLWEFWYDQALPGGVDLRIGLQSLDQEFMLSPSMGAFTNASFGWPALPSADQYGGGPAYPLSALGVRLRAGTGPFTVLAAVTDDNPGGHSFDADPQPSGGAFPFTDLRTGALFIGELDLAIGPSAKPGANGAQIAGQTAGAANPEPAQIDLSASQGPGLPGVIKLGAWFDSGAFPDPATANAVGPPVANPPDEIRRRHDFSAYLVADQTVWRPDPKGPRALSLFGRIMGAPGDRNPVTFSGEFGAVLKDPLPHRVDDTFGVGGGVTKIGRNAIAFDRLAAADPANGYIPVQSSENFLEVSYQYVPVPAVTVQPDLQYFFLPGAGYPDPTRRARRIGNALVLGTRVAAAF